MHDIPMQNGLRDEGAVMLNRVKKICTHSDNVKSESVLRRAPPVNDTMFDIPGCPYAHS